MSYWLTANCLAYHASVKAASLYSKWILAHIAFMRAVGMILLLAIIFLCGCATTIQDRRKERLTAYSQLAPDTQSLVDKGQIKVGMPKDAVYIAWGKPDRIIQGESDQAKTETWIYHGSTLQPYQYWNYGYGLYGSGPWRHRYYDYGLPYLDTDWYPVYYISAEVQFENGVVKSWRSLPHPAY